MDTRVNGKLVPNCPAGFRAMDGRLVRENKVLSPPPKRKREHTLTTEVKGKVYLMSEAEAHERLWGIFPKPRRQRYERPSDQQIWTKK